MNTLNKALLLTLFPITLGCMDQDSGPDKIAPDSVVSDPVDPGSGNSGGSAISLTHWIGDGHECLKGDRDVWCRGYIQEMVNSVEYEHVFSSTNPVQMSSRADSVCIETLADISPWNRMQTTAVYCFGEANLNWPYAMYDIVFSGPPYAHASHGSPNVLYPIDGINKPFMGGDMLLDTFLNQTTYASEIWPDSAAGTSQSPITCTDYNTHIECPGDIYLVEEL